MTTWPSNQSRDQWSAATTAAYIPQTVSMRAAAGFDATPTTARQSYVTGFAWSAEQPEYASPLPIERARHRFTRPAALIFGGALVVAAAAGLFGALHAGHSTPVNTTNHTAPAPVPAAAPAAPEDPAPTAANQTKPVTTTHSVITSRGSSGSVSHQSAPTRSQYSTPSSSGQDTNSQQWRPVHNTVSTPPTRNRDFYYWLTHRRDDDTRWTRHHDSDNHSTGSDDNGLSR